VTAPAGSGLAIRLCDAPIALAQSRPNDGRSPGRREWRIRDEALIVPVRVHPSEIGRSAMQNRRRAVGLMT
jgi:hypothetical protein